MARTYIVLPERPFCDIHLASKLDGIRTGPTPEAYYDGATKPVSPTRGSWAYMCKECFALYGVGLGLGKGQYICIKGERPPEGIE